TESLTSYSLDHKALSVTYSQSTAILSRGLALSLKQSSRARMPPNQEENFLGLTCILFSQRWKNLRPPSTAGQPAQCAPTPQTCNNNSQQDGILSQAISRRPAKGT